MQIKALDKSNNPLLTKRRKKIEELEMIYGQNKWWDNEERSPSKRGSLTKGQQCQTRSRSPPALLLFYPKTMLNFIQADYLQTPIQSTLDYTILCYITFRFLYFYCIVLYVQFPVTVTVLRVFYSQTKEKNVLFHNEKQKQ